MKWHRPPLSNWITFSLLGIFCLKVVLLLLFSSDYQNQLFIPFVRHFLSLAENPWDFFYLHNKIDAFPYHPLMLYITSLFYLPVYLLSIKSVVLNNLFFKFPTLICDIAIAFLLYKLFPRKIKEIIIFYFASPIIIYAAYMHSQLDLIPTALLFLSVYLLVARRAASSAFVFGLALCTKFHVIAAFPLMMVYLLRTQKRSNVIGFIIIPAITYFIISLPYFLSKGYFSMVLANKKTTVNV